MATIAEIRRMLEQFIDKRAARAFLIEGTVTSIDKDEDTFDVKPLDGGAEFQDVRLLPLTGAGEMGFVIYPKKDSNVLIMLLSETEAIVLSIQEPESIRLIVGDNLKLEVNNSGEWIFNDGDNGGLIIKDKLEQQVNKNSQILDALLQSFQSQVSEPGNGAPSVFQAALLAATAGMQTADLANITNEKIKH